MRGRGLGGAPRRPLGQFAGNPPDPNNVDGAVARELQNSMSGDPGIRLAGATGKRVWRSGGLTPQRFPGINGGIASEEALAALPLQAGTRARSLGQFRGTQAMSFPPDPGTTS